MNANNTRNTSLAKRYHPLQALVCLVLVCLSLSNHADESTNPELLREYRFKLIKKIPHDRNNFTQGLSFHQGFLYESTGEYGKSQLIKYRFPDMQVVARHALKSHYFGEGVEIVDNRVWQLTWKSGRGFIYSPQDLQPLGSFRYHGQGWGLCSDGQQLIASNGSAVLTVYDSNNFTRIRSFQVTENGHPVPELNELEWFKGMILANVWKQNRIIMIDPSDGRVTATIDLNGLLEPDDRDRYTDVLNGIAFNPRDNSLWVTGKRWPWLYQIELVEASTAR